MPKFTRYILPLAPLATIKPGQLAELLRDEARTWPATRSAAGLQKWAKARGVTSDDKGHGTHTR
jgi:hypothetical protein